MNDYTNKKSISFVRVSPETWEALIEAANKRGENPAYYIGWVLDSAVQQGLHKLDGEEHDVFWGYRRFRKEKEDRELVRRAAALYLEHETDEGADRLAEMCDKAGLNYDEVIQETRDDPFSSLRKQSVTMRDRAAEWLTRFIHENGGFALVKHVRAAAEAEGYNYAMLKRAKQAVNENRDVPMIRSEKVGVDWAWVVDGKISVSD